MHPLQTSPLDMCINLRGHNIGMAEHDLHRAKVGPAFEQMRGKRMPQHVR